MACKQVFIENLILLIKLDNLYLTTIPFSFFIIIPSRGNKYSMGHTSKSPDSNEFWEFSIDELASLDLPAVVDYVLKTTGHPTLTYIGYSQGSAQAFAGLSISEDLNAKISLFIGIAPAMKPCSFARFPLNYMIINFKTSFFYNILGKKGFMGVADTIKSVLPVSAFSRVISSSLLLMFG